MHVQHNIGNDDCAYINQYVIINGNYSLTIDCFNLFQANIGSCECMEITDMRVSYGRGGIFC